MAVLRCTNASTKYSALDRINVDNAASLRIAWRWLSPDVRILKEHRTIKTWKFETTPLMVGGVLFTSTSLNQVAAIDPVLGRTIWIYDPKVYEDGTPVNFGFTHRGVSFWSDGKDQRIIVGTGNGFLIALDARTGKPVLGFGNNGRVDLTEGLGRPVERSLYGVNSPVAICKDTIIVGSTVVDFPKVKPMPPGDVRASMYERVSYGGPFTLFLIEMKRDRRPGRRTHILNLGLPMSGRPCLSMMRSVMSIFL